MPVALGVLALLSAFTLAAVVQQGWFCADVPGYIVDHCFEIWPQYSDSGDIHWSGWNLDDDRPGLARVRRGRELMDDWGETGRCGESDGRRGQAEVDRARPARVLSELTAPVDATGQFVST